VPQQDYIQKVSVILRDNLQPQSHKPSGHPIKPHDCSCYVSRRTVAPPPLRFQERTELRAHDFAHSPTL